MSYGILSQFGNFSNDTPNGHVYKYYHPNFQICNEILTKHGILFCTLAFM